MLNQHHLAELAFSHLFAYREIALLELFRGGLFWSAGAAAEIGRNALTLIRYWLDAFDSFYGADNTHNLSRFELGDWNLNGFWWLFSQPKLCSRRKCKSPLVALGRLVANIRVFLLEHASCIFLPFRKISTVEFVRWKRVLDLSRRLAVLLGIWVQVLLWLFVGFGRSRGAVGCWVAVGLEKAQAAVCVLGVDGRVVLAGGKLEVRFVVGIIVFRLPEGVVLHLLVEPIHLFLDRLDLLLSALWGRKLRLGCLAHSVFVDH